MELLLRLRHEAKQDKNFKLADAIRDDLAKMNYTIKDAKDGSSWTKN